MLRTLALTLMLVAPAPALAEQFPQSALHAPVVADNGVVVGRVSAVQRDADGRIVAVEIDGLEPPSAPSARRDLLAERGRAQQAPAQEARQPAPGHGGAVGGRAR